MSTTSPVAIRISRYFGPNQNQAGPIELKDRIKAFRPFKRIHFTMDLRWDHTHYTIHTCEYQPRTHWKNRGTKRIDDYPLVARKARDFVIGVLVNLRPDNLDEIEDILHNAGWIIKHRSINAKEKAALMGALTTK